LEERLLAHRPPGAAADPLRLFPLPGKNRRYRPAVHARRRHGAGHAATARDLPAVARQTPARADAMSQASASCFCGAIRIDAELPSKWVAHCHCTMCRRAHGAAFVTWAGFDDAS